MIAKHGGFFRFVIALCQQEFIKSGEIEAYIKSGGLTGARSKAVHKVNKKKMCFANQIDVFFICRIAMIKSTLLHKV